jgi:hypothetical protein
MRAISGLPHNQWKLAFAACKALDVADKITGIPAEVELCGASMAAIHINIDLKQALEDVGCIPPQDYGNVLSLVRLGAGHAIMRLRGEFVGWLETSLKDKLPDWMQLERIWRDAVFENTCNVPSVPKPEAGF